MNPALFPEYNNHNAADRTMYAVETGLLALLLNKNDNGDDQQKEDGHQEEANAPLLFSNSTNSSSTTTMVNMENDLLLQPGDVLVVISSESLWATCNLPNIRHPKPPVPLTNIDIGTWNELQSDLDRVSIKLFCTYPAPLCAGIYAVTYTCTALFQWLDLVHIMLLGRDKDNDAHHYAEKLIIGVYLGVVAAAIFVPLKRWLVKRRERNRVVDDELVGVCRDWNARLREQAGYSLSYRGIGTNNVAATTRPRQILFRPVQEGGGSSTITITTGGSPPAAATDDTDAAVIGKASEFKGMLEIFVSYAVVDYLFRCCAWY